MTIVEKIYRNSLSSPQKLALIDSKSGVGTTYSKLWSNIESSARKLRASGLREGDRVIISASKCADFVWVYLGAHLAGITVAPVDSEINNLRLERIAEAIYPKLILGDLSNPGGYEVMSFESLDNVAPDETLQPEFPFPNETADILFTTGTTGAPKGVTLSFENEAQAAININSFIGNSSDDIELLALPISHSFGLGRLRCMLSLGATVVILGSFASMKKFFGAIEKYNVTGFGMVPASWAYISKMSGDRIGNYADQLKYIEIGSAPLPLSEKERLMSLLPDTKICMHYGLTEASRSSFISFHDEKDHLDSAGKASPNCELAIFSECGNRLGNEEDGEVCVRGKHVCSGYWESIGESKSEENSAKSSYDKDFFDGFFRTGDWGCIDSEGYLHLKSRTKEMINVGGKKVSPMEVEEVLVSVSGIDEAACIGVADPVMGEVVKAFVTGSLSAEDDEEVLKEVAKHLENYKVPASIVHIDNLPKTNSGKVQRLLLKEL